MEGVGGQRCQRLWFTRPSSIPPHLPVLDKITACLADDCAAGCGTLLPLESHCKGAGIVGCCSAILAVGVWALAHAHPLLPSSSPPPLPDCLARAGSAHTIGLPLPLLILIAVIKGGLCNTFSCCYARLILLFVLSLAASATCIGRTWLLLLAVRKMGHFSGMIGFDFFPVQDRLYRGGWCSLACRAEHAHSCC